MTAKPRNDRTWLWVCLGFVIAWMLFLRFNGLQNRNRIEVREGQAADYSWKLEDLDGAAVPLDRFRGKPVFLNIWATWCGPCVTEMPSISLLAANPRLRDVAFVCVSLDADLDVVRRFVRGKDFHMTILHSVGTVPDAFDSDAVPATFVIAPDGRIVRREIGAAEWDKSDVVATLEALARTPRAGF